MGGIKFTMKLFSLNIPLLKIGDAVYVEAKTRTVSLSNEDKIGHILNKNGNYVWAPYSYIVKKSEGKVVSLCKGKGGIFYGVLIKDKLYAVHEDKVFKAVK